MIRGLDDLTGRPYVDGFVVLPRLALEARVLFLVDTGADTSLLAPEDGRGMRIDYTQLGGISEAIGTSGIATSFTEDASIAFADLARAVYLYHVRLDIAAPRPEISPMPSLLGREVLDRWRMVYDPARDKLTFTVRSADVTIPLT